MKKARFALLYALSISILINGIGFIINAVLISNLDDAIADILRIGAISFSMFFLPCFLSAWHYQNTLFKSFKDSFKIMGLPVLLSLTSIYIIVGLVLDYKLLWLSFVPLFNGIMAASICVFSFLILYLAKQQQTQKPITVKFNLLKIGLIWGIISVIYLIFHAAFGHGISKDNWRVLIIPVFGILAILTTVSSIRLNKTINKPALVFSLLYLFNCFGLLVIYMLSVIDLNNYEPERLTKLFIQGIVIFSPYFLLITLAVQVYNMVLKHKTEKQHLQQIGVEASLKYQQLKAQLSPHFLFNNISVLTGLIEENPKRAVSFSEQLSNIYRYFLDQEHKDVVSLDEEINFGKQYTNLLQIRYEQALNVSFNIPKSTPFYIVPLALQQVFENVIKHNNLTIEQPIDVVVTLDDDYLIIKNSLYLKTNTAMTSKIGLENLKTRYSYFTDKPVMVITDANYYSIKLPLLNIK